MGIYFILEPAKFIVYNFIKNLFTLCEIIRTDSGTRVYNKKVFKKAHSI